MSKMISTPPGYLIRVLHFWARLKIDYFLHCCICERTPDSKFYLLVIIEELTDALYLKHKSEVVLVLILLAFLAIAKSSDFDVIEVTYALAREVRHEIVELVEGNRCCV